MIEYANCLQRDHDTIIFHFFRDKVWGKYIYKVSDIKGEFLDRFRKLDTSHFGELYFPQIMPKLVELYNKYDETNSSKSITG